MRWYSGQPSTLDAQSQGSHDDMASRDVLAQILGQFEAPVDFAFGYGSGVFSQGVGRKNANTQVDLILGIQDSEAWHRTNIRQHPEHYSALKHLGPSTIEWVQDKLGAGVYFNPFVTINGITVKYGTVAVDTLKRDLTEWNTLYLAGRLHKPVRILRANDAISITQQQNLLAALSVALLLLPGEFNERDLYLKVAGLSYMGDVRMALAENPNKVRNIVNNQFARFRKLYRPMAARLNLDVGSPVSVGPDAKGLPLSQSENYSDRRQLLKHLPPGFRHKLPGSILDDVNVRAKVSAAVRRTIKGPSFTQSAKGIITAGVVRSANYSLEKLKKRWL